MIYFQKWSFLALMKDLESRNIHLRLIIALRKLMEENRAQKKINSEKGIVDVDLNATFEKMAAAVGVREATISEIYSGKSQPEFITIGLVIDSMNKTFEDFGRHYDSATDEEINKLDLELKKKKYPTSKYK